MAMPVSLPFPLCPILVIPTNFLSKWREIPLVNKEQIIKLADGRKMTVRACCDFLTYVKLGRIKTDRPASKPKAQDEEEDEEDAGVDNGEDEEEIARKKTKFPKMKRRRRSFRR